MTPYNKFEKPPVVLSAQFQSAVLIALLGITVTLLLKLFSFSSDIMVRLDRNENNINAINEHLRTTDTRVELLTGEVFGWKPKSKTQ